MTTEETWEKIEETLDEMGVRYDIGMDKECLIEFWTDTAGQDIVTEFNYDGTPEDYVEKFTERAESYDVDEEVEIFVGMRGRNGVPKTVRGLIDDCQEAKDTLMEIARRLKNVLNEPTKEEIVDSLRKLQQSVFDFISLIGMNKNENENDIDDDYTTDNVPDLAEELGQDFLSSLDSIDGDLEYIIRRYEESD